MINNDKSLSPTIIDPLAKLKGEFLSQADVIITGRIEGRVESAKDIEIKEPSIIKSEVKATNVIVAGTVEGNIEAMEQLNIVKTARIAGDIKCKFLIMEPGAKLDGNCIMPTEESPAKEEESLNNQEKNCPLCQNVMRYIDKYEQWYCGQCEKYEKEIRDEESIMKKGKGRDKTNRKYIF